MKGMQSISCFAVFRDQSQGSICQFQELIWCPFLRCCGPTPTQCLVFLSSMDLATASFPATMVLSEPPRFLVSVWL